jgi:hypothetical protein
VNHAADGQGLTSYRKLWSYFQDRHRAVTVDHGFDGIDEKRTIRVDAADRALFEETDLADGQGELDGHPDARVIRTFGAYGPIVRVDATEGEPQRDTTFSYDDDGLTTGSTVDDEDDGVIDWTTTLTRDANGRLLRREVTQTSPPAGASESYTTTYTLCASR